MALKSSCLVMQLIRSIKPSNINFADELVTSLQHRNSRAPTNISVSHCSHSHLEEVKEKLSDKLSNAGARISPAYVQKESR